MNKLLRVLLVLALLFVSAGTVLSLGKQAEPFPEGSVSANRLQPGPLPVGSFEVLLVDDSRVSQPHGSFEGLPRRELAARVWYPQGENGGPFPLVVYSHGFSSSRDGGVYLAEHLAGYGYVVIAANYPLTNMYAPDRPFVRDVINQPGDVSFMIDRLLDFASTEGHALYGRVDPARIGVTGISLGGLTSTLVAFHPTLGDSRVGGALSIAGPTSVFTDRFFSQREVPFLMLGGDIDALVPFDSNARPVLDKVPASQLVTVVNGSHTGFSGQASPLRWMDNPDALGCYVVEHNIENDVEEPWFDLLGTAEQGIDHSAINELCQMDPLPVAMNPLRQHMITAVTVRAFFDSLFAEDAEQREVSARYLRETLAAELDEVSYESALPAAAL